MHLSVRARAGILRGRVRLKRVAALLCTFMLLALNVPTGPSAVAAQGFGGIDTHGIPPVPPRVFRGDVRDLPQIPANPKIDFEPREPVSTKPEPSGPIESGPGTILAPMPGPG